MVSISRNSVTILSLLVFGSTFLGAWTMKNWDPSKAKHNYNSKASKFLSGEKVTSKRYRKRRYRKKESSESQYSTEKKIQRSLGILGFYKGAIDGKVNADETRQAIAAMNRKYRDENTTLLGHGVKENLVVLADHHRYDKFLTTNKTDTRSQDRKIQTALKVLGYHNDVIDGTIGSKTRKSIAAYKKKNGLPEGNCLDFEEAYRLITEATEKNQSRLKKTMIAITSSKTEKKKIKKRPKSKPLQTKTLKQKEQKVKKRIRKKKDESTTTAPAKKVWINHHLNSLKH